MYSEEEMAFPFISLTKAARNEYRSCELETKTEPLKQN